MRSAWIALLTAAALGSCSCAPRKAVALVPDFTARLAAAEALLTIGCFHCLSEALREFEMVNAALVSTAPTRSRADSATQQALAPAIRAARGRVAAALMLEMRSRELGMPGEDFLAQARQLLQAWPALEPEFAAALETTDHEPWRIQRFEIADPQEAKRRLAMRQNLTPMIEARRSRAGASAIEAYSWLAFVCAHANRDERRPERLLEPLGPLREAPVVTYRTSTCMTPEAEALTRLLASEPRFVELNFFLGNAANGRLRPDEAEPFFQKAFQWRSEWPAVTVALGHLYVAFEEFERALDFYERTLAIVPAHGEARLGRIRALSYLERHDAALAAIDEVLNAPVRLFPGEAYYWQAWNFIKLGRVEDGWTAIEQAGALWVNSEVAKLAGLIAYQRREPEVALARFQLARKLNPADCEVIFNIGTIQVEGRNWTPGAETFATAATCLENARAAATSEIATITASDAAQERKARQVAKRQQIIAAATAMLATSWFNAAVSNFNLTRPDVARMYAEKVRDDERFGERAREILQRLQR